MGEYLRRWEAVMPEEVKRGRERMKEPDMHAASVGVLDELEEAGWLAALSKTREDAEDELLHLVALLDDTTIPLIPGCLTAIALILKDVRPPSGCGGHFQVLLPKSIGFAVDAYGDGGIRRTVEMHIGKHGVVMLHKEAEGATKWTPLGHWASSTIDENNCADAVRVLNEWFSTFPDPAA